jgi:hypothetical protein
VGIDETGWDDENVCFLFFCLSLWNVSLHKVISSTGKQV